MKVMVDVMAPVESQYANEFMATLLSSFRIAILTFDEAKKLKDINSSSVVFNVKTTEIEVMNLIRKKCEEMITNKLQKKLGRELTKEEKKKFDYDLIQSGPSSFVGTFLNYERVNNTVYRKEFNDSVMLFRQKHKEVKIEAVKSDKSEKTSLLRYQPITLRR